MQSFDLYPQAWIAYIVLGLILLFLVDLKMRKAPFALRAGFVSLLATGAFTPQQVRDADSYAPMVLNTILNAEVDGVGAIYEGLTLLLLVWGIIFATLLAIRYFIEARKDQSLKEKSPT
ncbi:hypothetical protein [Aliikangiella maris]|uniref:Uncharacterized protein n=2 Tax=Aliikangiella maris TaxID=3162458 RepID=A0ABV3MJP8_9GAMM